MPLKADGVSLGLVVRPNTHMGFIDSDTILDKYEILSQD